MMRRSPDFICIGAAKAGTTWLYQALANSPGYWMTPMKELNYFGHPRRNPRLLGRITGGQITERQKTEWLAYFLTGEPRDDHWYRTLFASAGRRITGDISPRYSRVGLDGIEHAKRVAPDAKIIMFLRNPADRDLSHLVHIATDHVFGTSKVGAVMDAIAKQLGLNGSKEEQRRNVRHRFGLKQKGVQNMDRLLKILGRQVGRPVSFDDVPEILEKRITLADVQAARERKAFAEQRKQSKALERWASVFGKDVRAFLYDDLIANPEELFARITHFLGRTARPKEGSILGRVSNPNTYRVEGLEELRAELAQECAAEREALRAMFGNNLPAWGAN